MEKRFYMFNMLLLSAVFAMLTSCSASEQKGNGKKKGAGDSEAVEGEGTATTSETGEETDETSGDEEPDSTEDPEAKIKRLLADCGANDIDSSDPNKVIYEKTLKSLPINKTVLIIKVKVESTLKISVTGKESKQDSTVEVKEVTGPFSELARAEADRQAKESSGLATLTNVPFDQYSSLADHEAWKGIVCTFVPITQIVNERGSKKTTVSFDPPLPSSISPKAVASRFKHEIGKKKIFDDIKATIKESDNPALADKKSISGSVTVRKVAAKTEVDDGAGGTKKIKADIAFEMTYEFGTPQETFALGMAPVVTYYISYEKKDVVANIVDTSGASGGIATFIHE